MVEQDASRLTIQTSFLALPPSTPVKRAIASMAEAKASCAVVIENQKLQGIFTERDVVRITPNVNLVETATLAELMTKKVIALKVSETQDVFTLSSLLSKHRIRHLPVIDDRERVIGVVTPQSIRNRLKPEYFLRYVRVAEVMNQQVVTGLPDDSILVLTRQMASQRVSCVVIVEPQTSVPIGLVTERDIVRFHKLDLDFEQVAARSVMSQPLVAMLPQESLWRIHQKMQELNVRRLVVVQPTGELAGIVTQSQILQILDPAEMDRVMQHMQEIIGRQTNELQQLNQKLQTANAQLTRLSNLDELTQVVNRRYFNNFLAGEWQRLAYLGKPLSLILCDVDNFKAYNDTYGHLAGDDCLVKIAHALTEVTRQASDLVARYGGEEFAVILPDTATSGAERVSQNILSQIQKLKIPHILSTTTGFISVSLGTATIIPDCHSSPEILLQIADGLLYQSKQKGRNTYSI